MIKTENYILLKKCVNCGSLNNKANTSCLNCGTLFIKEMSFAAWTDENRILGLQAQKQRQKKTMAAAKAGGAYLDDM